MKGVVDVFQALKQVDSKRQAVVHPTAPLSTRRLLNQSIATHSATQHNPSSPSFASAFGCSPAKSRHCTTLSREAATASQCASAARARAATPEHSLALNSSKQTQQTGCALRMSR